MLVVTFAATGSTAAASASPRTTPRACQSTCAMSARRPERPKKFIASANSHTTNLSKTNILKRVQRGPYLWTFFCWKFSTVGIQLLDKYLSGNIVSSWIVWFSSHALNNRQFYIWKWVWVWFMAYLCILGPGFEQYFKNCTTVGLVFKLNINTGPKLRRSD